MADRKRGIKSQKYTKNKRFARSYYELEKAKPTTIEYLETAKRYYYERGSKGRMSDTGCEQRMLSALIRDAYEILFLRHNPVQTSSVKLDLLDDVHKVIEAYGKKNILYVTQKGSAPRGAVFFPYSDHLCLVREKYGMPFESFLRCLLGEKFADTREKYATLSDWTGIPEREIRHIYLSSITAFFRDKSAEINSTEQEKWVFCTGRTSLEININNVRTINIFS